MKILSICIPTYNKIAELTELVDGLLKLDRSDFEIVITDNASTDGTQEKFQSHPDQRVCYFRNAQALPPFVNMIHSIFNASGKYVLYCNDRDLIIPEKLEELIDILICDEFAFIHGPAQTGGSRKILQVYEKGFDSLIHHDFIHHPTGMVFNRKIMDQYLHAEDYERYLPYINTYDFLMLDLFQYGKSARYQGGYWKSRTSEYIGRHISGTRTSEISKLYFSPETRERMFYGIIEHALVENNYQMSLSQKIAIADKIYLNFAMLFGKYKACMSDPHETAHYGLTIMHISTKEIVKIFSAFFDRSILWMNERGFDDAIIKASEKSRIQYQMKCVATCVKININNLIRRIK